MRHSIRHIVASVIGLALLAPLGAIQETQARADSPAFIVVAWMDNRPRVMKAGKSYTITIAWGNSGKAPEPVRFQTWSMCHTNKGTINFRSPWQHFVVPTSNPEVPTSPALITKVRIKVPKRCSPPATLLRKTLNYTASVGFVYGRDTKGSTLGLDPHNNYIYGPFTKTWYKYNLHARADYPTIWGTYQAHHTLPQKYAPRFARLGLNVHNPKWLRWWCSTPGVSTNHAKHSKRYNNLWDGFFSKNPKPSLAAVLAFRSSIQGQFKFECP